MALNAVAFQEVGSMVANAPPMVRVVPGGIVELKPVPLMVTMTLVVVSVEALPVPTYIMEVRVGVKARALE